MMMSWWPKCEETNSPGCRVAGLQHVTESASREHQMTSRRGDIHRAGREHQTRHQTHRLQTKGMTLLLACSPILSPSIYLSL